MEDTTIILNLQTKKNKKNKTEAQRSNQSTVIELVSGLHGVAQSWTQLSDFAFTFHFRALEKEMETHSSVLAWRISGTGGPGGLLAMGLHRVGHN